MSKKLIYLILALFVGGFIVIQSCNESPIMTNEPFVEKGNQLQIYENNGILTPRVFYGIGTQEPIICETGQKVPIYAGQNTYAGYVEITSFINGVVSGNLVFQNKGYPNPTDPPGMFPWAISEIHIHIANTLLEIPQNPQGSPTPGQFALSNIYNPPITGTKDPNTNLYYIPFTYPTALTGSEFFMAVHAVVCTYGGVEGFNFYLPNGQISYTVNYNSPASYYKVNFLEGSGFLSGSGPYESFCVDADISISPPATLTGQIYSSYESLPSNLQTAIDNWENLDLVNWLLNTYPVGSSVPQYSYSIPPTSEKGIPFEGTFTSLSPSTGQVTWQDLQAAIWALLEDGDIDGKPLSQAWNYLQPQSALTLNNVWGLVFAALNSAPPNFVPGCNQSIIAILVPDNPQGNIQIITIQPTLITLQMPCSTQCETAWGDGKDGANFVPNKTWSTYFKWNINDCTIPNK